MAFDACMMRAVINEFNNGFPDAKIEKVLQPASDEINLLIHSGKQNKRLVFNAGANCARLQTSDIVKENPKSAPMFCMLLRKYLLGGRIISCEQLGFDRIAEFKLVCYDDMGFPTSRSIISEIMGKYANLILLDSERKVLAAMKVIDFAASEIRQVLPGLKYQLPEARNKINPTEINRELFFERLSAYPDGKTAEKFITDTYGGIATQIARELCYRTAGATDIPLSQLDREKFYLVFEAWQRLLISHDYTPTVVFDDTGKPKDYSYMDITYLGDTVKKQSFATLGELFDLYFAERDRIEKTKQRAKDILTLLSNTKARTERKLAIQREALLESEHGEAYRRKADLITANLYKIKRGDSLLVTEDFYEEGTPTVEIELDKRLSPSANAQRMYKLYNKAKNARVILTEQIALWEKELIYLESVSSFLERASTEADIAEIREELYRSGYASRMKGYKPQKQTKLEPIVRYTEGGLKMLIGRNNTQNDHVTFKLSKKDDIWFHVKDAPGSHLILITEGYEPTERDYTEAAELAAAYSSLSGSPSVAVDYTRVKNVKKPPHAKPGFVIYKTNYTAYVKPKEL